MGQGRFEPALVLGSKAHTAASGKAIPPRGGGADGLVGAEHKTKEEGPGAQAFPKQSPEVPKLALRRGGAVNTAGGSAGSTRELCGRRVVVASGGASSPPSPLERMRGAGGGERGVGADAEPTRKLGALHKLTSLEEDLELGTKGIGCAAATGPERMRAGLPMPAWKQSWSSLESKPSLRSVASPNRMGSAAS